MSGNVFINYFLGLTEIPVCNGLGIKISYGSLSTNDYPEMFVGLHGKDEFPIHELEILRIIYRVTYEVTLLNTTSEIMRILCLLVIFKLIELF